MRLAARQAEAASESTNSGDNGGENTSGQEDERQQEQENGQDGTQQDGQLFDSSSSIDSGSTSQDTSSLGSPSSSSSNQDPTPSSSAGDSGSPTANPTGTGSQSEDSEYTPDTSDTSQDSAIEETNSSSSSYTPRPTTTSESLSSSPTTMDQSSTSDDNNIPSPTSSTSDTPTPQPDSSTSSPTDPTSDTSTTSDPTPTSDTKTTEESTTSESTSEPTSFPGTASESTSESSTDVPTTSSISTTEVSSPTVSQLRSASTNFEDVTPSMTSTLTFASPSALASGSEPVSSNAISNGDSSTSPANQQALGSISSSSNIALGDQLATTVSPAVKINASPSITHDIEPSSTDESGNNDGGNANSNSRDPSLNGAGDGSSQNSKMIGGTVAGIIAAIVIIVFVVWLIGKRRRQKFVKPVVERMHASGSGYSLPSMLNGPGSGSGSGSGGATPATSSLGHVILTATRRRSRAFSIESASIYDHVDISPEATQKMENTGEMSQVAPLRTLSGGDQDASFLPGGAAPHLYRTLYGMGDRSAQAGNGYDTYSNTGYNPTGMIGANSSTRMTATKHHQQIPSASSFGSHHMLDSQMHNSAEYQNSQHEYSYAYDGLASAALASSTSSTSFQGQQASQNKFYQNAQHASPTREVLVPSLVKSDSRHAIGSPFDDEEELHGSNPMPHSPTMTPTLLQRRTTDPFSNKHSLRVINVDRNKEPGTPSSSTIGDDDAPVAATPRLLQRQNEESRPFSNWSSIAPSRASTSTMSDAYSTFHFDSPAVGGGGNYNGFGDGGRISRGDSLDANRRLRLDHTSNFKRSSSSLEFVTQEGEILTPRQVNDVGFFREV